MKSKAGKSPEFGTPGPESPARNGLVFNLRGRVQTAIFLAATLIPGGLLAAHTPARPPALARPLFRASQALSVPLAAVPAQDSQTDSQKAPEGQSQAPKADPGSTPGARMVVYEHGLLTIVAENVRLSDIMDALHAAMGTEVDLPAGSSTERIWARLGPGPARKVLSELLGNTDLNYVIQGSSTDPAGVQSVALTLRTPEGALGKSGFSSEPSETVAGRRRSSTSPVASRPPDEEASAAPEPEPAAATPVTPPSAPTASATAGEPAPASAAATAPTEVPALPTATGPPNIAAETPQPPAGSFNPHPTPPVSLTPEQMAQQLSNMYQQRRQMQQSQIGSTQN